MRKLSLWVLIVCLCTSLGFAQEQETEPDHEVHEELRALLKATEVAINTAKYEGLEATLSEQTRVTTSTQDFLGSNKEVAQYMADTFGPGKKMESVHLEWEPAVLTELSPDKSWGLAYGTGIEDYVHSDGRTYNFRTRWTAVVAKEPDGKYRIRAMHMGANFLDNPILSEVERQAKGYASFAGIGGLVLGLLLGVLLGRRRS